MSILKVLSLSVATVCFSFSLNVAQASKIKWVKLNSIQQSVLKKHVNKWNGYSEKKQKKILLKSRKSIKRLTSYKIWFKKHLTESERTTFYINKRKMSRSEFNQYADTLFRKYGKPDY